MKFISVSGLRNPVYIFDETDELCKKCSYPLDNGRCFSCNIFKAEKYRKFTGGKFHFERIFSIGKYLQMGKSERLKEPEKESKDIMTWLVYSYKNDGKFVQYCVELFNLKISSFLSSSKLQKERIIICTVPDDKNKIYKKADLLLKETSTKLGLFSGDLLKKIKENKKQHNIKGENAIQEKFENVRGVFEINQDFVKIIPGKIIFLLDDVISSMATTNECSRILKEAGAKEIYAFSLGRNILLPREEKNEHK